MAKVMLLCLYAGECAFKRLRHGRPTCTFNEKGNPLPCSQQLHVTAQKLARASVEELRKARFHFKVHAF